MIKKTKKHDENPKVAHQWNNFSPTPKSLTFKDI